MANNRPSGPVVCLMSFGFRLKVSVRRRPPSGVPFDGVGCYRLASIGVRLKLGGHLRMSDKARLLCICMSRICELLGRSSSSTSRHMEQLKSMNDSLKLEVFIEESGEKKPFQLEISSPHLSNENDYYCKIRAPTLFKKDKLIYGVDEEHARSLAIDFVRRILAGKILIDENDCPVEISWPKRPVCLTPLFPRPIQRTVSRTSRPPIGLSLANHGWPDA